MVYKDTKDFSAQELQELFLSVEWSSGHYPDKLVIAMKNSGTVFSAWDTNKTDKNNKNKKLIGLINVLDDGIMTAYVHYLLVNPKYQRKGIGRELLRLIHEKYKDYLRIVLVAHDDAIGFYKNCGFTLGEGKSPMFITSLWT